MTRLRYATLYTVLFICQTTFSIKFEIALVLNVDIRYWFIFKGRERSYQL